MGSCHKMQQKFITTNRNRSHVTCFQGKFAHSLSMRVGSNHFTCFQGKCHVNCTSSATLHKWGVANVNRKLYESNSFISLQARHVHSGKKIPISFYVYLLCNCVVSSQTNQKCGDKDDQSVLYVHPRPNMGLPCSETTYKDIN